MFSSSDDSEKRSMLRMDRLLSAGRLLFMDVDVVVVSAMARDAVRARGFLLVAIVISRRFRFLGGTLSTTSGLRT